MAKNYKMADNNSSKDDIGTTLVHIFLYPMGCLTWVILGVAGVGIYLGIDESRAKYTTKQDTIFVTGIHKDLELDRHARHDHSHTYNTPNVFATGVGSNGKEYNLEFKSYDGSEAGFVERGDSIVVNFTYRNNKRHKDSMIVNLTKQKMIQVARQNRTR